MQKSLFLRFIMNDMEHKQLFYDSKTILQEMVQSQGEEPLVLRTVRKRDRIIIRPLKCGR